MEYILWEDEVGADSPVGGKARALAALRQAGFDIPAWCVVLPKAYNDSLSREQRETLARTVDATEIAAVAATVQATPAVQRELNAAVATLCPAGTLSAVRSSASDEDGPQHSFAGQLESFLFVAPERIIDRVAAVWRSGFSERVVAYRREHGLPLLPRAPAVLIQRMIEPEAAGVAFGADPVSGRRGLAVVAALYGVGSGLVTGECDADTYHVDRTRRIVYRHIAEKHWQHVADPASAEGIRTAAVASELVRLPALSDEQIVAVADIVRRAGKYFGRPQDIEWAARGGKIYLLQSRPITALASVPDPDGPRNIWDNSNIAESYNGVTTPLTFSFARRAYEEVYRQFCRILRVPEPVIAANDRIFPRMLGLIRGRIYYNLLNWYRLLALLPGYQMNRAFMEQMMGVKEGLPAELAATLPKATWRSRLRDGLRFIRSLAAIVMGHFTINRKIRRFYRRLEAALGDKPPELDSLRADELADYYRQLESRLLTRWDAPLVNDFLAMIFYGALRKLAAKWCGDVDGTLQNDLLCGGGGMISAEPALRVKEMAEIAAGHHELSAALCDAPLEAIRRAMDAVPQFNELYQAYLAKFGDRCMEELKLESPTLHDEPLTLLRAIGRLARKPNDTAATRGEGRPDPRTGAQQRVRRALRFRPLRRLLFRWVLGNARARVRDRENLRFERTRLFGRVRRIFVELGKRYFAEGVLTDPRDIFFLEVEEALGFIDGTVSTARLQELASLRRREFSEYTSLPPPPDRFETCGTVHVGNRFEPSAAPLDQDGDRRQGLGCCPGVVRGPARVVRDPRTAQLQRGDILVAERTDPGWIMLFPAAAGLLVERGSLLSHSAIVAREMGIPAIVSLAGVTRWLKDGDWVELDGATGIAIRLPVP